MTYTRQQLPCHSVWQMCRKVVSKPLVNIQASGHWQLDSVGRRHVVSISCREQVPWAEFSHLVDSWVIQMAPPLQGPEGHSSLHFNTVLGMVEVMLAVMVMYMYILYIHVYMAEELNIGVVEGYNIRVAVYW